MTRWRTLALATVGFNFSFLLWFSFAPFTVPMSEEFGLSTAEIGILASAAFWLAPLGRILTGWLTDRFGAPIVFGVVLGYVGVFSVASAFARSYEVFFATRLIVATAGVSFVVGIQHVSEWFEEDRIGLAEGIYAGFGNAGAAAGALLLPRAFGPGWSGPIFEANWRAAFFYTGIVSVLLGIVYLVFGEAARSTEKRAATRDGASFQQWLYTATRYGTVVLAFAYVASFGLELSMNSWLPTYYQAAFDTGDLVLASTFAATFSVGSGSVRPLSGYVSDRLASQETDLLPVFRGRYREQWTFATLCFVVVALLALTAAGLSGRITLAVAAGFLVGTACGLANGAIFALVPSMFPNSAGAVSGVVGGVGTVGGIVFPLLFAAPLLPNLHAGYAVVAVAIVPILLLVAWGFRPAVASVANTEGLVERPAGNSGAPGGDD